MARIRLVCERLRNWCSVGTGERRDKTGREVWLRRFDFLRLLEKCAFWCSEFVEKVLC